MMYTQYLRCSIEEEADFVSGWRSEGHKQEHLRLLYFHKGLPKWQPWK